MKLARDFYDRPTLDVARDLLGKVLVHQRARRRHERRHRRNRRPTSASPIGMPRGARADPRNAPLYGPPGHAYVYLELRHPLPLNVVHRIARAHRPRS